MNEIIDIPRLYTAMAEWSACALFASMLKPRMPKGVMMVVSMLFLTIQSLFLWMTEDVVIWLWLPCMLIAYVLMVMNIYTCAKVNVWEASYYAFFAFVIAEWMASFEWQIFNFIFQGIVRTIQLEIEFMLVGYFVLTFIFWGLLHVLMPQDGEIGINRKDWATAMFICINVFALSNLSFLEINIPFTSEYAHEIANIRTLVDFAGVAMLYAHLVLCSQNKVRMELETVQMLLEKQYQQYQLSKENIDLLNYRCHDLKHQIQVLRKESDINKREEYLNQMEEDIRRYEVRNMTGNSVLDIVLNAKSMTCSNNGISLTVVADGALLEFMETMDICSVFGNALDNAIESALKLDDKEKRLIHVTVSKQKGFLIICFENYFEGELKLEDNVIRTTKGDEWYHGYGIKSIIYTINKYDGVVNIKNEYNWFVMKIVIPIPDYTF